MTSRQSILLTGVSGFIATHLLSHVESTGCLPAEQFVLLTSRPNNSRYRCVEHSDYCFNEGALQRAEVAEFDAVIHLGAYTPKSGVDANRVDACTANISNTLRLLSQLKPRPRRFVFASTVDVYGPSEVPICEATVEKPGTLYGASKLFGERLVENWCRENGVLPQILRIGHVYGRGEQAYRKLIPETIRRLLHGERPVIYTDGSERRSFLHVTDCVRAIIASLCMETYPGPINIASGRAYTIRQIVDELVRVSGSNLVAEVRGEAKARSDVVFDNAKMEQWLVGETISIENGLRDEYNYVEALFK